jgi:hypothetical protein
LIVYASYACCVGGNIAGRLCVLSRLNHTAQLDLAMIAIDSYQITVAHTVMSKRALDLGD